MMGRKSKQSTTAWRQRYLVNIQKVPARVEVLLMRGRMKKDRFGDLRGLVSKEPHNGWGWKNVSTTYSSAILTHNTYERHERDRMIADLALLRMQGYHVGEVPSW